MQSLTERQSDALAELINIAFGRTAAALSELTGQRILLDAPKVALHAIEDLFDELAQLSDGEIATVHQIFMGPLSGDAFLVLDYEAAVQLVDLFVDDYTPERRMDASAREVVTEVGNILLNACLGMFGELLQVRIRFAVPRLRLEDLNSLLSSLVVGQDELRHALVAYARFRLRDRTTSGYFIMVLGVTQLDSLIQAVGEWEEKQTRAA